jgi:hypothetical protein
VLHQSFAAVGVDVDVVPLFRYFCVLHLLLAVDRVDVDVLQQFRYFCVFHQSFVLLLQSMSMLFSCLITASFSVDHSLLIQS